MIFIYAKEGDLIQKIILNKDEEMPKNILWIDFFNFSNEELYFIEKSFNIKLPNDEEKYNIEESARYWEDKDYIRINNVFINKDTQNNTSTTKDSLAFLLHNKILFTLRNKELPTFNTVSNMLLANPKHFNSGFDILNEIFDVRVDKDGDILEWIDAQSRKLRMDILEQKQTPDYDFFLEKISNLQDLNMQVRFSLFEKKKTISSLIKSDKINANIKENLDIILKDLNSFIEFNMSLLGILDNIQSILTNKIDIEQNKIIKLFTIVTVAMMPPTLIGTIYGMNFENMPELKSEYGYFIALIAMVLSTIIPIIFFKKKGWL
ncbi:magnesium/cobalt transporter CorA [Campylobacter canadensis]|uniref:Magnesium transport protein CorA n=1 Tax=Campylobacter canadensis TaxID=449520 RepID=A0ABS7WQT8_9BACT|nr:magnesium/cobalt transporter CorA [Campylobacter canadensis]MBZ7987135.1 magnesium/cobalt transporter CorA [Campylobacter canadensis]MBZ7994511.1 magnesium/cobalt transporter CorA [Campylobacter canadensis]MBZ7997198.1 magnesium/cobalt transporter CorA [Campylobacter canadensis]MBZ7998241.1 magnesium/cobalt transporter CorA [Campylobacter canadensis]MBZ7999774.1 magnesium/cobalt transporter CorA [Campylobacter canadensis]